MRATKTIKIPKGYKPQMTKAEVVAYLKKFAPDYPLRTITRGQGSYWKETAYLIERGRTGELVVLGRKSEIEAGKLFGTVSERTAQRPYYTKVMKPEIYKDLTAITRMGRQEYVWKVKAMNLKDVISMKSVKVKPLNFMKKLEIKSIDKMVKGLQFKMTYPTVNPILKYRIGDILMGRQVGQFKKMTFGEIVPIERYRPIPESVLDAQNRQVDIATIKKLVNSQMAGQGTTPTFNRVVAEAIGEEKLTRNIKQIVEFNLMSSSGGFKPSAISYGEQYTSQIKFPTSSSKPSARSYTSSYTPSLKSSIRSLISSGSSSKYSSASSFGSSAPSYSGSSRGWDYYSGYSGSSSGSSSSSTTYSPPPILALFKASKSKKSKGKKATPEIEGLFPDFTSRVIGLAPIRVAGVEGAMREIQRLQTGLSIRKGARIDKNFMGNNKGNSNLNVDFFGNGKKGKKGISDKALMRSVMG